MKFNIDYATWFGAQDAIEFAIDECNNRILEADALSQGRTAEAWKITRDSYQKTLDRLIDPLPVKEF